MYELIEYTLPFIVGLVGSPDVAMFVFDTISRQLFRDVPGVELWNDRTDA